MLKTNTLSLTVLFFLISSCASVQPTTADYWLSRPSSELIESWGEPDSMIDKQEKGKILIYFDRERIQIPVGYEADFLNTTYNHQPIIPVNAEITKLQTTFFVSKEGIVTRYE